MVTDGPFAEAKEVLGGFWLIEVGSLEEAVNWAKQCPGSNNETIEIRQIQDVGDWPEAMQPQAQEWDRLREKF